MSTDKKAIIAIVSVVLVVPLVGFTKTLYDRHQFIDRSQALATQAASFASPEEEINDYSYCEKQTSMWSPRTCVIDYHVNVYDGDLDETAIKIVDYLEANGWEETSKIGISAIQTRQNDSGDYACLNYYQR